MGGTSEALRILPSTNAPATTDRIRSTLPPHLQRRVSSARELIHREEQEGASTLLPTLITPFDRLLAGGLPQGGMVELVGRRSSGRLSTTFSALAAATSRGEVTALVDLGNSFSPQSAVFAGVVLERLLWVCPRKVKEALISTEMLLTGGFPLVVLELGEPPLPGGRGGEAFWLRLARAAASHGSALLISSPYRVSGTAARKVIKADCARPLWAGRGNSPQLLIGRSSHLTLEKAWRDRPSAKAEHLQLAPLPALVAIAAPPDESNPESEHQDSVQVRHLRLASSEVTI